MSPRAIIAESPPVLPGKSQQQETLTCTIKVITPIFGGGYEASESPDEDPIRATEIRGHLRFWWRATKGAAYPSLEEMFQKEQEIWGGTKYKDPRNDNKPGSRESAVKVEVGEIMNGDTIKPPDYNDPIKNYALFPATEKKGVTHNIREGVEFKLELKCGKYTEDVLAALKAWLLFGGYGSRTRRGVGALQLLTSNSDELNNIINIQNIDDLKKYLSDPAFFIKRKATSTDMPVLPSCTIALGTQTTNAKDAWLTSLGWLRNFRQTEARPNGNTAHPGQTAWPEPDKIRELLRYSIPVDSTTSSPYPDWEHPIARGVGNDPAWPRAVFGLPIIVNYQDSRRNRGRKVAYQKPEPGFKEIYTTNNGDTGWKKKPLKIQWIKDGAEKPSDRLASPLIVKPLAFANDNYVPVALWLNRAFPSNANVCLLDTNDNVVNGSKAPFDKIAGITTTTGGVDTIYFAPLKDLSVILAANGDKVKTAFFAWLKNEKKVEVLP